MARSKHELGRAYEPFQPLLRLAELIDGLAQAGSDPEFRFTMDGRMAAGDDDDDLEVLLEQTDGVHALGQRGQPALGA